ncbi:MAG: hypothetical protein JXR77_11475, partial [Lentisphaeria bacterium]|nr:hypothetical protein [Lentisphaeria bacterium]
EGYEDAAAIGPGLLETRWGRDLPVTLPETEGLYAFVRAKPGDDSAPAVVHLVDWRQGPLPFTLRLRPEAFFGDRTPGLVLHTPTPYAAARHQAAEEAAQQRRRAAGAEAPFTPEHAAAYAELSRAQVLRPKSDGAHTEVQIPALTPWGILVISRP